MSTARQFTIFEIAAVGFIVACCAQPAQAGWTGAMNGVGYGQATVNVRAFDTLASKARNLSTTNMQAPSAAITTTTGYVFGAPLPQDASPATVAKVKGLPGYIWQATTVGSNGDTTDNAELESRVNIVPADCAALEMSSEAQVAPSGNSGTITVNANGTAGTAIWLRGFEFTGGQGSLPEDDPNTPLNEFVEFLKANGVLKWDVLMVGPFALNTTNCTALTIPFTIDTDTNNLYFVSDGVAKSLPLVIYCPADVSVACDQQPVVYPPVQFAGCGDVTISYAPAPGTSFPVGVTPVTVTATDKDGNTTNCTFNVTVTDTTPPVVPALDTLTGEASVTVPQPSPGVDNCGGTVSVSTTNSLVYNTQGTFIVYWDFDDGHGNTNTVAQTVIVDDVTAPVPPTIAAATGQCSVTVTPPTAADEVVGSVIGTTGDPTTYLEQGTFTITWIFNDGNGNTSTANQTVIVQDTTPPAAPVLATVTGACGANVTLPVPTTTDNCGGTVTATPNVPQVLSTKGTNVVQWTFTDAAGNSSTAYQTGIVAGLTFKGFYSPIGTVSNTCSTAVCKNWGRTLPIKFDMFCGTSKVAGGQPPVVKIQRMKNCQPYGTPLIVNAMYLNYWHYNWSTAGCEKDGTYKITVTMPDGQSPYVFIKIKDHDDD